MHIHLYVKIEEVTKSRNPFMCSDYRAIASTGEINFE
jgi:hypothetical protein